MKHLTYKTSQDLYTDIDALVSVNLEGGANQGFLTKVLTINLGDFDEVLVEMHFHNVPTL